MNYLKTFEEYNIDDISKAKIKVVNKIKDELKRGSEKIKSHLTNRIDKSEKPWSPIKSSDIPLDKYLSTKKNKELNKS